MAPHHTLVLGATPRPDRYAYLAVQRLVAHGHTVTAVGRQEGRIGEIPILREVPEGTRIHTVTLYLNANNQREWEERILALHPERIIFNPGAENERLAAAAQAQGIEAVEGCTLVMLSVGTF
jgi:predicted CoA-binding protein